MAVFLLPQIVSIVGVDLILSGIHAKEKSPFGEKSFLSRFTKIHKKKENNAFDFCMIQFSQSYCFYKNIYVVTEVCKIQKERNWFYEIYSFVWKCDRSNRMFKGGGSRWFGYFDKNICSSQFLIKTVSSGLILNSPEILRLFSILGLILHWSLLSLSWSLFSRLPWFDLSWSMGAAHCLHKLKLGSRRFLGTPMNNDM